MPGFGITDNSKLWVFGQSMSLPYNIGLPELGWPSLVSKKLNIQHENYSQAGADNFFIYHTFLENLNNINDQDLVIIGWSHPSRKSFVVNSDNPVHQEARKQSLVYTTKTKQIFRSNNSFLNTEKKWSKLTPASTGINFYDNWFDNYYSLYEQTCNFLSYTDSVKLKCPGMYVPFYFSKESIQDLNLVGAGYMLDFIKENNVAISKDDYHLNEHGHQLWADHIYNYIKELNA
jgi:hypothetical protein